jgi:hypothetical protein
MRCILQTLDPMGDGPQVRTPLHLCERIARTLFQAFSFLIGRAQLKSSNLRRYSGNHLVLRMDNFDVTRWYVIVYDAFGSIQ